MAPTRAAARRQSEPTAGPAASRGSGDRAAEPTRRPRRPTAAGRPLPGQHRRRPVDDGAGAATPRRRREARRLRALRAPLRRPTVCLDRSGGFARRQATQWRALAAAAAADGRLPLLSSASRSCRSRCSSRCCGSSGKKSVMHYLGSDIRGKTPEQLASGKKAGAEIVGSYDAIRWVPEAEVIPPGIDLSRDRARAAVRPRAPRDPARALVATAQGHRARDRRRRGARRRPRDRRGAPPRRGVRALPRTPTSSSTSSTPAGTASSRSSAWRSASRSSPSSTTRRCGAPRRRSARRVPIVSRDRGDAARAAPAARRRRGRAQAPIGAASRAYVELVHDLERIADRLLDVYARL